MYEVDMMFIYKRNCPNIDWIDSVPSSHFQLLGMGISYFHIIPYYPNVACVDFEGLTLLTFILLFFCPFCMLKLTTNLIKQKLCCTRYIKLQP